MYGELKSFYAKTQFWIVWPINLLAVLVNPSYLIRKNLFHYIRIYAKNLTGRILDFGCGSKPYKDLFVYCQEYVGCDIETSGHDHTNEKIDYYYDGTTLPFADESFDWVFSSEVFEHIFNLDEILKELNRVTAKGGGMLITVPFVWNEHEVPFDYARYTSFGIEDLLKKNGFEIIRMQKSTLYVEAIFQMMIVYIINFLSGIITNRCILFPVKVILIAPITVVGLFLGKILPRDESFFCNNIVLCRKI